MCSLFTDCDASTSLRLSSPCHQARWLRASASRSTAAMNPAPCTGTACSARVRSAYGSTTASSPARLPVPSATRAAISSAQGSTQPRRVRIGALKYSSTISAASGRSVVGVVLIAFSCARRRSSSGKGRIRQRALQADQVVDDVGDQGLGESSGGLLVTGLHRLDDPDGAVGFSREPLGVGGDETKVGGELRLQSHLLPGEASGLTE